MSSFLQTLSEQEEWNGGQGPVEQIAVAPKDMKQTSKNKTLMHMLYRTQAEEEEVSSQHDGLIKFFQENPSPSEDEMNAFADQMGTDPDALDERIYALLSSLLKGVGKSNDMSDDEFDADQLAKGIDVEMEHTEDELIAKMIAKDHLAEIPDYYDRLGQMEDEAGVDDEDMDVDMEMGNGEETDAIMKGDQEMEMPKPSRRGAEEEEDMDMEMDADPDDLEDEDMDLDNEYDDEEMEDPDMDLDDEDMDDEDVDPEEVLRLAKQYQSGEIDYAEFLSGIADLDTDDEDMDGESEFDDEDMDGDESDYESGDLEDDEFEVDLGQMPDGAEEEEQRPRRRKRVRRMTFKESLISG